ncbi:hypothetical protein EV691_1841, partial [Azotobacter chroococcum]
MSSYRAKKRAFIARLILIDVCVVLTIVLMIEQTRPVC